MAEKHCATCTCHSTEQNTYLYIEENLEANSAKPGSNKDENAEAHNESSSDVELIEEKHPFVEVFDSENEENQSMTPITVTASESDEMSDVLSLDIDVETIDEIDPDEFVL